MEKGPARSLTLSRRACGWINIAIILCIVLVAIAIGLPLGLHSRSTSDSSSPGPSPQVGSPSPAGFNKTLASIWKPINGTTWQIVLLNPPELPTSTSTSPQFDVWDIDLFDNPTSTISQIHALDSKALCYFSAGTYENWRPDASQFHPSDLGSPLSDWPGERWLNTSSPNVRNIMLARIDLAVTRNCDGIDPDNVDGYDNSHSLGLTQADAAAYVDFLADATHGHNLSIGLKNAGDLVSVVIDKLEWSVQEQCIQFGDCDSYRPFIDQGKPVFHVEYPKGTDISNNGSVSSNQKGSICTDEAAKSFSTIIKNIDLDQWLETC